MNRLETPKLSICITTFNRANFIGATLQSILPQITLDCEVVVLDGGSTDDTESVVRDYARRFGNLRYFRQRNNSGFDRDCDRVVELARGEYCWLMSDDDLLKSGAVSAVLERLSQNLSLLLVNVEFRNFDMSRVLQKRWLDIQKDRLYAADELDRLFVETYDILLYVGCVVIQRKLWLERERERYFGSLFVYVGIILQEPLPGGALVLARPHISYRMGNSHTFSQQVSEIMFGKWPSLLGGMVLSDAARKQVVGVEPWRSLRALLLFRGWGIYSLVEYRRWVRPRIQSSFDRMARLGIALLPGSLVNICFVVYFTIRGDRGRWLEAMRQSHFHPANWRLVRAASPGRADQH